MEKFYLITGSETFEKQEMLEKIKKSFGTLENGINYIVLDKESIQKIELEANTMAFGYSKKLIVVNLEETKSTKETEKATKEDNLTDTLITAVSSVSDFACIVFYGDFTVKSKLFQFVEKNGKCVVFDKKKENEIIPWCRQKFEENHVSITNADIMYLINISGTEKQVLKNEIDKLCSYAMQSGRITTKDIELLCIRTSESIIFDLTDCLGNRNIKRALMILQDLIDQKEPLPKIFIMIAKHFKSLLVAKLAVKQGKNLLEELDTKSTYAANKYKSQARLMDEKQLTFMIQKLARLDVDAKVGKIDLKMGLEKWICEI